MKIGKKTLACYFGKHEWMKIPPDILDQLDLPIDLPSIGNFEICPRCFKFKASYSTKDYELKIVPIEKVGDKNEVG